MPSIATARMHHIRLVSSALYQRREAAHARTHTEAKLRAAYYVDPDQTVWPALFAHLHDIDEPTSEDYR